MLYGSQVTSVAGLTRWPTPNFLIGVLGGYETFDYRSDAALQGHLTGEGWTVGSYLGWRITQTLRFDAAVAYSGIGHDGTAGTAPGNFGGDRWLVTGGLTGTYQGFGLGLSLPRASTRYGNMRTPTPTRSAPRRPNATSRPGAPAPVSRSPHLVPWSSTIVQAPYLGLGAAIITSTPTTPPLHWRSPDFRARGRARGLFGARAIAALTAKFANGGQIALGTEFSAIGGNACIWIYLAQEPARAVLIGSGVAVVWMSTGPGSPD